MQTGVREKVRNPDAPSGGPKTSGLDAGADRGVPHGRLEVRETKEKIMTLATVLWILAVILVVAGVFAIIRKQVIWGVVLIVVGLLVGPGGVSIFT